MRMQLKHRRLARVDVSIGRPRRSDSTEEAAVDEYQEKCDRLDRLLNDPDVVMEPDMVWALLAEISAQAMADQPHS